jgi:RTX calcium-binding nonapeptide repeat (4 copies)/WD40-like Beta Propeller Repeat
VQHLVRRALIAVAACAAALIPLSAAEGGAFAGANGPIAYTCGANVCTVNPDGSSQRTLISNATDPTWSSDESEIAYVTSSGIAVADADGSFPALLPTGPGATQPTLSFSGSLVAYVQGGDIWTIPSTTASAGTNRTNTAGTTESDPAYSPDGTKIAYVANGQVNILNASLGFTTRAVTTTAVAAHDPTWSPDGSTIAYADSGQIYTIASSATSGAGAAIAAGSQPAYSPDGSKLALINVAGHLAVVASSGGTPAAITGTADANPDWEAIDPSNGPPRNTVYPTITLPSGDTQPVVGHFLVAGVGSWDGSFPISYKFQWKRCDAADRLNGTCVDIANATSSFYTPTSSDLGKRLRVQVTATNSQGTASQNSEPTEIVIAIAPKVRSTPVINGGNVVDTPLTLTPGLWEGSLPITFTYSWRRCNATGDPDTCVQIPGANDATYTPAVADIGFSIRVWITGTNPQGSDTAITNHTFPIVDKPHFAPSADSGPLIAGTAGIGRQLTANTGAYSGDAPIKTQFTWQRCDATGEACHIIGGATKVVYFPTAADVGFTLRIVVTAANSYGQMTVKSTPTEPIAQRPPHIKGRTIIGSEKSDYEAGGGHDDRIFGRGGNDTVTGGAGDDLIEGGDGNDIITGGSGADRLYGGPASDTIYAADGERDTIDCGAGRDRVVADSFDKTVNCEVVASPPATQAAPRT